VWEWKKLQDRGLKCIKRVEEILGINRIIAKQSLVPIRKGYKYAWESKIETFLLHKAGGNHKEQPFPVSISNHKSSVCSLYQAQKWKKNNCKVKNQEFEVKKERVNRQKQKKNKEKKENRKGVGEYHPSTPSKFFQIHEVRVILYPWNLLWEVLDYMRRKPKMKWFRMLEFN